MGAGSTVFAKNVLGDCMFKEALKDSHIALYDIDKNRLEESVKMLTVLNKNVNDNRAKITAHLGVGNRKKALKGADFVVNAIQVGGYEPSTACTFFSHPCFPAGASKKPMTEKSSALPGSISRL